MDDNQRNKEIGSRIKSIRIGMGLNMENFGKLIIPIASKGTISSWESGKYLPNNDRLKQIAEFGNVSMDYLLDGKKNILDLSETEIQDALKQFGAQPAFVKFEKNNNPSFTESMKQLAKENTVSSNYNDLQISKKLSYPTATIKQINFLISCEMLLNSDNINSESQIYSYLSNILDILGKNNFHEEKAQNINLLKNSFEKILKELQ